MAIKSVDEVFDQRTGAWTTDQGRSYSRVFRVITNNPYDGPNLAIQACGVSRGDQYIPQGSDFGLEVDPNAYAHSLTAVQEEGDSLGWLVTIEYGPYSALWAGGGPAQNPLLQPIDISFTTRDQEVITDMDVNGNAIVNTAGDPYDPPLMEDDPRMTLTIVRNEAIANVPLIIQYQKAINSDQFGFWQPLQVKVISIEPKSLFHQDIGWYYQMTYVFEAMSPWNPNAQQYGYRRCVLNQGVRALSTVTGKPYHVVIDGVPVTEPVLLSKSGSYSPTNAPYWSVWQTKPELPFAAFNFDPLALSGLRTGFNTGYGVPG